MATTTGLDAFAPAHAMVEALRARQVSSRELVDLYLERIERYNGALNAIVVPAPDPRGAAQAADAALHSGDDRAILGLPVTLKESMNVPGLPTTVGVLDFKDFKAPDMGAIPSKVLGQGAAAVAAGLSPLEFGSDIGGSIRVPAAFCGIFGHKPSETAVPRSGQFPRPSLPNAAGVMGVQGPLARTAEDLELAMRVIAGPEIGEDVAWRLQLPPPRAQTLPGVRVAIMPRIDWLPVSAEILAALDTLASRLARAGATVKVTAPEALGDMREHHGLYVSMLNAFMSARVPPEERARLASEIQAHPETPWAAAKAAASQASIGDWLMWHARREEYRAAYRTFFGDWDILLAPITLRTAFPHMDVPMSPTVEGPVTMLDIDGTEHPYQDQLVYPGLATFSGQPATAFPVGLGRDGLPLSLQAIGPYLEDLTPIRFAALASAEMGGVVR